MSFYVSLLPNRPKPIEYTTTGLESLITLNHLMNRTPIVRFVDSQGTECSIAWSVKSETQIEVNGPLPPNGRIILE